MAGDERDGAVPDDEAPCPLPDVTVAHPARVYKYLPGGKGNFGADREAAEQMIAGGLPRWRPGPGYTGLVENATLAAHCAIGASPDAGRITGILRVAAGEACQASGIPIRQAASELALDP